MTVKEYLSTHHLNTSLIMQKLLSYLQLMRLHQPTGIWLLLWPCWWSIALASNSQPDIFLLAIFALGAIIMRGAGCVVNDIIDRKIDAQIERTKNRPLASGKLSLLNAYSLLAILLSIGLFILYKLNNLAVILSLIFFIPVLIYPFMKRIMAYPQIFLALTFNSGAIIGWAAVTNSVEFPAIILYFACIFWTIGYDTIYAHQDKNDDEKIGVKSSALSLRGKTRLFVTIFYLIMTVLLLIVGIITFTEHSIIYYIAVFLALIHLIWQIRFVNLDDPNDCMKKFCSNSWLGGIIFLGILIEGILTYYG